MKRNLILIIMAVMIVAGIGATSAKAEGPVITKLMQKFGIKDSDIKNTRSEVAAERLTRLVEKGKITESQKQAIISKRAELDTWSTQNKIDLKYLFGFGGGKGHMGRGMMRFDQD